MKIITPRKSQYQFFILAPLIIKVNELDRVDKKKQKAIGQMKIQPIKFDKACPPFAISTPIGNKNQLAMDIIIAEIKSPKLPNIKVNSFFIVPPGAVYTPSNLFNIVIFNVIIHCCINYFSKRICWPPIRLFIFLFQMFLYFFVLFFINANRNQLFYSIHFAPPFSPFSLASCNKFTYLSI